MPEWVDQTTAPLVSPFSEEDTDEVVALWELCFVNDPPQNEPRAYLQRKMSFQPDFVFIARFGEELVGSIVGGYDGVRGWMYHLSTHPAFRRKGVATALVRRLEHRLREVGCSKLNLQIRAGNEGVADFYRSLDYLNEARLSFGKKL